MFENKLIGTKNGEKAQIARENYIMSSIFSPPNIQMAQQPYWCKASSFMGIHDKKRGKRKKVGLRGKII
jgi:hypothetical protein